MGKKGRQLYLPGNPRKRAGGKSEKNSAVIKIVVKFYGVSFSSSSSTASWDAIRFPRGTHMDVSSTDCRRGVISSRRITVLWTTVSFFFLLWLRFASWCCCASHFCTADSVSLLGALVAVSDFVSSYSSLGCWGSKKFDLGRCGCADFAVFVFLSNLVSCYCCCCCCCGSATVCQRPRLFLILHWVLEDPKNLTWVAVVVEPHLFCSLYFLSFVFVKKSFVCNCGRERDRGRGNEKERKGTSESRTTCRSLY